MMGWESGETAEEGNWQLAGGPGGPQYTRRIPGGLGWAGLVVHWPNDAESQAEGDGRALGPSYRWSHVQLQSHRPVSEPIAALQSSLVRVFSFCLLAHLPKRDPGLFFSNSFIPFPPSRASSSKSQSPLSRVSVCVCVWSRSAQAHTPICQGRKETSATCQPA